MSALAEGYLESQHPRGRRGEWVPSPGAKVRLRAKGGWGALKVIKAHLGLADVEDRHGNKHTYALTDLQPLTGHRLALAEAIAAREDAKTSLEFVRARAREQVLREWVYCDDRAEQWLEESEKTAGYSSTHSPLGKPGGPGLWKHKGLQLPAYIQNVAKGVMKTGKTMSQAIQIAIGTIKRWARGGGKVSPEVRAAAAKALAEWEKLKASH